MGFNETTGHGDEGQEAVQGRCMMAAMFDYMGQSKGYCVCMR